MDEQSWEVITTVPGDMYAEILRGLLEAQGIPVVLSQEGIGRSVYAVNVGLFGKVEILVPSAYKEQALQVLKDYESGAFQAEDEEDNPGEESELPTDES